MRILDPPQVAAPNHIMRLAWLLTCVLVGLVIAAIGNSLSESPVWYVAIPVVVAIGWMFLANPTECTPASHQQTSSTPGNDSAP
jgi:hypothetical protein